MTNGNFHLNDAILSGWWWLDLTLTIQSSLGRASFMLEPSVELLHEGSHSLWMSSKYDFRLVHQPKCFICNFSVHNNWWFLPATCKNHFFSSSYSLNPFQNELSIQSIMGFYKPHVVSMQRRVCGLFGKVTFLPSVFLSHMESFKWVVFGRDERFYQYHDTNGLLSDVLDHIADIVRIDSHETCQYPVDLRIFCGQHATWVWFDFPSNPHGAMSPECIYLLWLLSAARPIDGEVSVQTMTNSGIIHCCQYINKTSKGIRPLQNV